MTEVTTPTQNGGNRPVPDPTVLTTEALTREVSALKALLELRIESESGARESADTFVQAGIERELQLIERQRVEQKKDTKDAVDAALAAAKEAVKEQTMASGLSIAKSENATNEQLKQLGTTFTTAISGVDRTINDWKDRVNKVEQVQAAQGGQQQGVSATVAWILAGIGGLVAVASIIIQLSH